MGEFKETPMLDVNKKCEIEECENILINSHILQQFCKECSKQRRKNKLKEYNKNKKVENIILNRKNSNLKRNQLRAKYREEGLCSSCGKEKHETLTLCLKCHEISLKASIKRNRKNGMKAAGNSSEEERVYELLLIIFKDVEIIRNTYKILRNPITNSALELDFYLPSLNLAFEIDGPMHRIPCYGLERLESQIRNDNIKNQLCIDRRHSFNKIKHRFIY